MPSSTPHDHQTRFLRWSLNLFLAFCLLLLPSLTFMTGEAAQASPQAGCTPDFNDLAIHTIQGSGHLSRLRRRLHRERNGRRHRPGRYRILHARA